MLSVYLTCLAYPRIVQTLSKKNPSIHPPKLVREKRTTFLKGFPPAKFRYPDKVDRITLWTPLKSSNSLPIEYVI